MRRLVPMVAAAAVLVATACDTTSGYNTQVGQVIGGITGGIAGSHIGRGQGRRLATSLGALLGALLGGGIVSSLERGDQLFSSAAPSGSSVVTQPPSWLGRSPGPSWLEARVDATPTWFRTPSTVATSSGYRTADGAYTPGYTLIPPQRAEEP
ncbi:MAG: glycine zipper 2TM domain-containing protein [Alphaproteobacteria bacterium]